MRALGWLPKVRDFIWPVMDKLDATLVARRSQGLMDDLASIDAIQTVSPDDAADLLDEARRLADAQDTTRSTLETRAGIFVAAIGALIPVLIFASEVLGSDESSAIPHALRIFVSLVASTYLGGALWWALQVFKVRRYFAVSTSDLTRIAGTSHTSTGLLKELLKGVRQNRDVINSIVDAIRLTQWLLWRSAVCFLLLLVLHLVPDSIFHRFNPPIDWVDCGYSEEVKSYACRLAGEGANT